MSKLFNGFVILFLAYQAFSDIWLMTSKQDQTIAIMNWPLWVLSVEAVFTLGALVVNLMVFLYMMSLLKRYHNYEYKSRKKSLIGYFIVLTLYYFVKTCIAIVLNACYTVFNP
mmetsp:Transcript_31945/g.48920  ORF Transcript_31945/g.48920 Transcript_31945/m.48920 type:complete len:113 (+) Transcript_31945:644-982(+)